MMNQTTLTVDDLETRLTIEGFHDTRINFCGHNPEMYGSEGRYTLIFRQDQDVLQIELGEEAMQQLGAALEACRQRDPEAGHWQAYKILLLGDASLEILIRNLDPSTLIDALWYLNDERLLRKIIANCTFTVGDALLNALCDRWLGQPPGAAAPILQAQGQQAVVTVLGCLDRLAAEGQISVPYQEE